MIGKAHGVVVKNFDDYTDGDAITKLNQFIRENPDITIIDIKYFNGYSVTDNQDMAYGRENATIIYREPTPTYGSILDEIEKVGFLDIDLKFDEIMKNIDRISENNQKLIDKYKK